MILTEDRTRESMHARSARTESRAATEVVRAHNRESQAAWTIGDRVSIRPRTTSKSTGLTDPVESVLAVRRMEPSRRKWSPRYAVVAPKVRIVDLRFNKRSHAGWA